MRIHVKTQSELDLETKKGNIVVVRSGFFVARENSFVEARENSSVEARGHSSVVAWGNSSVVAWENSSVEAWGNSSVVAWENSFVEAWGNASVVARENSSVVAWGNSSVVARENSSVKARGNVFIRLYSASKIRATINVVIMQHDKAREISGGIKLDALKIETIRDWCEFYGVKIQGGFVTLYKALDSDFLSPRGTSYAPGSKPEATDWDGGEKEFGKGLHFSPSPYMAKAFNRGAIKFVACPIRASEIALHPNGEYPEKVKARAVSKPCYEVDIEGKRVAS